MPSALRASAIREREVVRSHASYITSCAFAVASSPRCPLSTARKLSIARLSGTAAAVPVFVEVLRVAFERGFFETGIAAPPLGPILYRPCVHPPMAVRSGAPSAQPRRAQQGRGQQRAQARRVLPSPGGNPGSHLRKSELPRVGSEPHHGRHCALEHGSISTGPSGNCVPRVG